jgi:hypothetical protein
LEAVSKVKLFSAFLLLVSIVELLDLLSILFVGGSGDTNNHDGESFSDATPITSHEDFFVDDGGDGSWHINNTGDERSSSSTIIVDAAESGSHCRL